MPPRVISMLLIGQLLVVFLGVAITGGLVRAYDIHFPHVDMDTPPLRIFPHFVRDYGLWLCLLPLSWAVAAVWNSRGAAEKNIANYRYEFMGWLLLASLLVIFSYSAWVGYGLATYTGLEKMIP